MSASLICCSVNVRHDAPRLANRLLELLEAQLTPGEVRSKAALALLAVAIPAPRVHAFPKLLARLGIALGGGAIHVEQGDNEK